MATNYLAPLEQGKYYHIYNRGNDRRKIFFTDNNYRYFLSKYDRYLSAYLDTFAYCLMPTHFHFLVKVKVERACARNSNSDNPSSKIISEQCRRFFMAYSKAINKQENRNGSLFQKNFKRKEITSAEYLAAVVYYIHDNPVHHMLANELRLYPWSSYGTLVKDRPTKLKRHEVLRWFGGKEGFIDFHIGRSRQQGICDLDLEGAE